MCDADPLATMAIFVPRTQVGMRAVLGMIVLMFPSAWASSMDECELRRMLGRGEFELSALASPNACTRHLQGQGAAREVHRR
eukprot:SAG11_NODE_1520_length_4755_cov_14.225515_3_plen_82_part_00